MRIVRRWAGVAVLGCRALFRRATGPVLPPLPTPSDPAAKDALVVRAHLKFVNHHEGAQEFSRRGTHCRRGKECDICRVTAPG